MTKLICTHSGSFHADDALGVAMLKTLFPAAEVVRSRDPEVWAKADILVDVGGEHDVSRARFDHHQKGFERKRKCGTPYAGAGLVWETYGADYVRFLVPELSDAERAEVVSRVDTLLIRHADAFDSGIEVGGPFEFGLAGIINGFNNTWVESDSDDERFALAWNVAGMALRNLTVAQAAQVQANSIVRDAECLFDGRVLVLEQARIPYDEYVVNHMPGVLFAVYPESRGAQYQVRVIPQVIGQFKARADLPAAWAGLREKELSAVTGVPDAVFCHNGRFIAGAGSKDGALTLAKLAIEELAGN